MDFIEVLAFGVVGFLSGVLSAMYIIFKLKNDQFFEEIMSNCINSIANDKQLHEDLFLIGGIIGSGIKGGVGLKTSPTRTNLKSIGMELLAQFLERAISNPNPNPPSSPAPSSTPTQDINAKKISDKW